MSSTIFNEGRVVGLSAYESYVRRTVAARQTPVSEGVWLLNTMTSGKSLLVQVPEVVNADSERTVVVDIPLPSTCTLVPQSTIHADFFWGSGHSASAPSSDEYSKWVDDYGVLIHNTAGLVTGTDVPASDIPANVAQSASIASDDAQRIRNYAKIVDGLVLLTGTWVATNTTPPADLHPKLDGSVVIRLRVKGGIDGAHRPYIVLSGFIDCNVLAGAASLDGSVDKTDWLNGAYLGPEQVPWAAKIVFNAPSAYTQVSPPGESFALVTSHNTFTLFDQGQDPEDIWSRIAPSVVYSDRVADYWTTSPWQILVCAGGSCSEYTLVPGETYKIQTTGYDPTTQSQFAGLYGVAYGQWGISTDDWIVLDQYTESGPFITTIVTSSNMNKLVVNNFNTSEASTEVWIKE